MKIKHAELGHSVANLAAAPAWALPEIAVIGRSNVGKSSMVNMLTQRRSLAKTSGTPGKTRLLNFFLMDGLWSLVDLPGYGYAKVSRREQNLFDRAVADYLAERPNLREVWVLLDSRIPPQANDLAFLAWLGAGPLPYVLLFNKAEKLSANKIQVATETFMSRLADDGIRLPQATYATSGSKGLGRSELLERAANVCLSS